MHKIMRINISGLQNKHSLEDQLGALLIYCSIILPILAGVSFVPSGLKYLADVIWIALVLCTVLKAHIKIKKNVMAMAGTVALLFVYVAAVYLCRFQSLFYFIWGVRNLFRYYIAFFAYVSTMTEDKIERWFDFIEKIFWINLPVSIFQFVFMGVSQDFLGGVFGIDGGTNGYTVALLCIVVTRSLLINFEKQENMKKCFATCIAALMIAAMAELRFFFVLFVILMVSAAIITRFSFKKLLIILGGMIGVLIGVRVLVSWFEIDDFFSIQGIIKEATRANYATATARDVNRLSAIPTLNRRILHSPLDRIFGLGLGNCDTSNISIFNSVFYRQHNSLHYTWFTGPMIYLETGYIGLALYLSFFCICFVKSLKKYKEGIGNKFYCQMTMIMSGVCCMLAFYNASLRYEAAYMIYLVLALPFLEKVSGEKVRTIEKEKREEISDGRKN